MTSFVIVCLVLTILTNYYLAVPISTTYSTSSDKYTLQSLFDPALTIQTSSHIIKKRSISVLLVYGIVQLMRNKKTRKYASKILRKFFKKKPSDLPNTERRTTNKRATTESPTTQSSTTRRPTTQRSTTKRPTTNRQTTHRWYYS